MQGLDETVRLRVLHHGIVGSVKNDGREDSRTDDESLHQFISH